MPHNDIEVRLLMHFAKDILYSPLSVIWEPQQLLELDDNTNYGEQK